MANTWQAPKEVWEVLERVRKSHPRLDLAKIAVAMVDSKPFIKNRFNWGRVSKFSPSNKIWMGARFDFCINICTEIWSTLTDPQRDAFIDLHLTRLDAEYEPETVIEGKKKVVVRDEMGRIKYTSTVKLNDNGEIKWIVYPLDLLVFAENIKRYGLWTYDIGQIKEAVG